MTELSGDLFSYHHLGPICITTNVSINRAGQCTMGRGVALQAKRLWPGIEYAIANKIKLYGNKVQYFPQYGGDNGLFTFPVKHH